MAFYYVKQGGEPRPVSAIPECTKASSQMSEVVQASPASEQEALGPQRSGMEGRVAHCHRALALCQVQSPGLHAPCNPRSSSWESIRLLPCLAEKEKPRPREAT